MGISGLLKGLKGFTEKRHIRDFSGQSLAVDASSWLHKSVYSASERYVESMEVPNGRIDQSCVAVSSKYVINRCQELLVHAGIGRIFLVLDGQRCPLKTQTNQDREERRRANLADARRYKRAGRADKAGDKYKACIKIKSHFAKAVVAAVMKRFAKDGRVQCVFSPYEADAQLVKLCLSGVTNAIVTEDSDVAVYLASCHCSYPILFKLERDTGSCDVVTMDWLLSSSMKDAPSQPASAGALDSILRSLASRELNRPGVGARLFVQACVLAGCDYSPSRLNGVGLVTAFKLVRDNAHRPAGDRFRHLLVSLSKKARGKEDMVQYEEILAKSEAVFYYHPVLQLDDEQVIPLTAPLTTEPTKMDGSDEDLLLVSDRRPCMERFGADWSFLGRLSGYQGQPSIPPNDETQIPLHEIAVPVKEGKLKVRATHHQEMTFDAGAAEVSQIANIVNPYAQSRKRKPLATINPESLCSSPNLEPSNPFAKFARHTKEHKSTRRGSGMEVYLQSRQDVRFVKRDFSADTTASSFVEAARQRKVSDHLQKKDLLPHRPTQQHGCVNPPYETDERAVLGALDLQRDGDAGFAGCVQDFIHEADPNDVLSEPRVGEAEWPALNQSDHIVEHGQFLYEVDSFEDSAFTRKSKCFTGAARRVTLEEPTGYAKENSPLLNEFNVAEASAVESAPVAGQTTRLQGFGHSSFSQDDSIDDIPAGPTPEVVPPTRTLSQNNGGWISKIPRERKSTNRSGENRIQAAFERQRCAAYSDVEDIEIPLTTVQGRRTLSSRGRQGSIRNFFGPTQSPANTFPYS